MSLHFSEDGAEFPDQLVNALLAGEVVFLCGAGISAPHLPTFSKLVDLCFDRLGFEKNPYEISSYEAWRFEEVLGSLSRRTVDPKDVQKEVVKILSEHSQAAELSHHHTILKLSRNLENRCVVVTTNFDTLLEKAFAEKNQDEAVKYISFSGQDLPIPGSSTFDGIIHIHGRMADDSMELAQTPMVLTSADYGDAYMRSGWASRFLFDLCRCKTVVLLGYSAGDAPVRYFLNVLEADRQRFSDVLPVYAMDTVKDLSQPDNRWGALAVKPIIFESPLVPGTQIRDYSALWNQLEKLSELVMKPRATRKNWANSILQEPYESTNTKNRENIEWLLKNKLDLFPIVKDSVTDVEWIEFFINNNIWTMDYLSWLAALWLSKDLESAVNFRHAIKWLKTLDSRFKEFLFNHINSNGLLPPLWKKAWLLLISSKPRHSDNDIQIYNIISMLEKDPLKHYLYQAVEILTPKYRLSTREISDSWQFNRIADLFSSDWSVGNLHSAAELLDALAKTGDPILVLSAASAKLAEVLNTSLDLDSISEDFDRNDYTVPSVEPHTQNEHHDGVLFLVQILSRMLHAATLFDMESTKKICATWYEFPGYLGKRLWLHSLRNEILYSADEALSGIDHLPTHAFWHIRREIALVLKERSGHASPHLLQGIEQRIILEGKEYYDRYEIYIDQFDWRQHALDKEVWLRLSMLKKAGSITQAGLQKLSDIFSRRSDLMREVNDQDFFGTYNFPVENVIGNAQQIIEADESEKLDVARRIIQSPDIRETLGWSTYCRTEPEMATHILLMENLDPHNAPLWNTLLGSIKPPQEAEDQEFKKRLKNIFVKLIDAPDSFLTLVVDQFVGLYVNFPIQAKVDITGWWIRLVEISAFSDNLNLDTSRNVFEDARYSTCGQLTAFLLNYTYQSLKKKRKAPQSLQALVKKVFLLPGRQGFYARAVLMQNLGFVISHFNKDVLVLLKASLDDTNPESVFLKSILVNYTPIYPKISKLFTNEILQGLQEISGSGQKSMHAANILVSAAISLISKKDDWNLTLDQISLSLRKGPPQLREGALFVILSLFRQLENDPGESWRLYISNFIALWPRDKTLHNAELSNLFCRIAILSGNAFPDALDKVLPFISGHQGNYLSTELDQTELPELYPVQVLQMLWKVNGRGNYGFLWGIQKILNRLVIAKPGIEEDRRFQWLDQAAMPL